MKKILLIMGIALLVLFAGCSSTTSTPTTVPSQVNANNPSDAPKNWDIKIKSYVFNPTSLVISKGDTITWQNMDNTAHTVTSDSGNELASETMNKDDVYSHTFEKSGTYNYHCNYHTGMVAKIIVK